MSRKIADKQVKDVMKTTVITVTEEMTVKELKEAFDKYDFNAFPVVRGDRMVGIITKLDLMRTFSSGRSLSITRIYDLWAEKVKDVMRTAVISVKPEDSVQLAVDYMVEFKLRSLPVLDGKRLVGVVSRTDVLGCLLADQG
jgi:CBS domain-containing protein